MILLTAFAFFAGAATALSPCALPVLPVVFSAGSTGGRRRPAGVAAGLAVSFTFAVVVLVYVISALGLPDNLLRTFAIAILLVFGLSLVVPKAADYVEATLSKLMSRRAGQVAEATQGHAEGKEGFWSGFLVGSGLGFVYAPCAGPILAGVITVTASQEFTTSRLVVALAYGIGSATVFFGLMIGGRRLIAPLMRRTPIVQTAMGVTMIFVAIAMYQDLDVRFQTTIADKLPAVIVNPTGSLERSSAIKDDLDRARGVERSSSSDTEMQPVSMKGEELPDLGPAADFTGNQRWFNTLNGRPLSLDQLRGKVVLVDFWTYTCINCIRTLPHLKKLWAKYRDKGFVLVGVHSPEFPFERSAKNVEDAIRQSKLTYPVAQDNEFATWNAYENEYWPSKFLIDAEGRLRYTHVGEGAYGETDRAVRSLLAEAGRTDLAAAKPDEPTEQKARPVHMTPETYLGSARAAGFVNAPIEDGLHDYKLSRKLPLNTLSFGGKWRIDPQSATSAEHGARLDLHFNASRVYLVLGTGGSARELTVRLDGKTIAAGDAGRHVKDGSVTVRGQKLYSLVDLKKPGNHRLSLRFDSGVSGFAFTFG